MTEPQISPRSTVNAVLRANPETISLFHAFGIDACCGGALTLEEVARRHGLDLTALLAALRMKGAA